MPIGDGSAHEVNPGSKIRLTIRGKKNSVPPIAMCAATTAKAARLEIPFSNLDNTSSTTAMRKCTLFDQLEAPLALFCLNYTFVPVLFN